MEKYVERIFDFYKNEHILASCEEDIYDPENSEIIVDGKVKDVILSLDGNEKLKDPQTFPTFFELPWIYIGASILSVLILFGIDYLILGDAAKGYPKFMMYFFVLSFLVGYFIPQIKLTIQNRQKMDLSLVCKYKGKRFLKYTLIPVGIAFIINIAQIIAFCTVYNKIIEGGEITDKVVKVFCYLVFMLLSIGFSALPKFMLRISYEIMFKRSLRAYCAELEESKVLASDLLYGKEARKQMEYYGIPCEDAVGDTETLLATTVMPWEILRYEREYLNTQYKLEFLHKVSPELLQELLILMNMYGNEKYADLLIHSDKFLAKIIALCEDYFGMEGNKTVHADLMKRMKALNHLYIEDYEVSWAEAKTHPADAMMLLLNPGMYAENEASSDTLLMEAVKLVTKSAAYAAEHPESITKNDALLGIIDLTEILILTHRMTKSI